MTSTKGGAIIKATIHPWKYAVEIRCGSNVETMEHVFVCLQKGLGMGNDIFLSIAWESEDMFHPSGAYEHDMMRKTRLFLQNELGERILVLRQTFPGQPGVYQQIAPRHVPRVPVVLAEML